MDVAEAVLEARDDVVAKVDGRDRLAEARGRRRRAGRGEGVDRHVLAAQHPVQVGIRDAHDAHAVALERCQPLRVVILPPHALVSARGRASLPAAGWPASSSTTRTGMRLRPFVKFERRRAGEARSARSTRCAAAAARTAPRISSRARCAPRQKCGPPRPNAACTSRLRVRSRRCGSGKASGSRLAAANQTTTLSPSRIVSPRSSVSRDRRAAEVPDRRRRSGSARRRPTA